MSGSGDKVSGTTKTPAVVVKLNSGVDYRGFLACLDGYMNIAMEQTEEYVNGQLKNKYGGQPETIAEDIESLVRSYVAKRKPRLLQQRLHLGHYLL